MSLAIAPETAAARHTETSASSAVPWARVQAVSGLVFFVFAALHLVNTSLGAISPAAYNAFQRALRPIYQFPAVEIGLVLLPIAVHATASIVRIRQRRGTRAPASWRKRAHRYAGYFLLTFIVGHIGATRLPALLADAYPEFEGVAFTFQFLPLWFYPYYAALALAGLLHATIGVPVALGVLGLRVPAQLQRGPAFWVPAGVAAVALLLGVAGLGGLLYEVPDQSAHPFAVFVQDFVDDML